MSKLAVQLNELILNSTKLDSKDGAKNVENEGQKEQETFSQQTQRSNIEFDGQEREEEELVNIFAQREEPDLPQRVVLRLR